VVRQYDDIKITSEHIFLCSVKRGWTVISLKETVISTTLQGKMIMMEEAHTKQILHSSKYSLGLNVLPFEQEDKL